MGDNAASPGIRTVHVEGLLTKQPVAVDIPLHGQPLAEATVIADGQEIPVRGLGEVATSMAATEAGERVELDGVLHVHRWKTAGRSKREKWEIQVTTWKRLRGRSSTD
jgi:hypothetical protein